MNRSSVVNLMWAVGALAVGGGIGWIVLAPGTPTSTANGPGGTGTDSFRIAMDDPGSTANAVGANGSTGTGPGATGEDEEDDESDLPSDEGLDRVPFGPEGGAVLDVEALGNLMREGRWLDVERMLRAAGGSSDPRVTALLMQFLSDDRFRNFAAGLFEHIKDPAAAQKLLALAGGDAHEWTRAAAVRAAAIVGGPGVQDSVLKVLRGAEPGSVLAMAAAGALGTLGTPEAARALIELLRDPAHAATRGSFIENLARMHSAETIEEMARLAGESGEDSATRIALVQALARTKSIAAEPALLEIARKSDDPELRRESYKALAAIGGEAGVTTLLNVIAGADNEDKFAAAVALAGSPNTTAASAGSVEKLVTGGTIDAALRPYLITALGSMGSPTSVAVLAGIAGDANEDAGVRATALRSLARIDSPDAREILLDALEGDSSEAVRRIALDGLQHSAGEEDLPRLKALRKKTKDGSSEAYQLDALLLVIEQGGNAQFKTPGKRAPDPLVAPYQTR